MEQKRSLSWKLQFTFVITGVFVGILVTAQFRSSLPASSYPYDEFKAQQELIKSYSDDQAVLKTKILNLRKQIEDKQKQGLLISQKNNLDTLSQLKKAIGLESAKGSGVEITLNDGFFSKRTDTQSDNQSLVYAADLRDIVNLLYSAQVDGIAINGQRVIASTPITSVGNTILVNNFHVIPPFNIDVIGDPDFILQRYNDPKALPDLQKRIKAHKVQSGYKTVKNLVIPVFSGDFRFKFLQVLNELNI